MVGRPDRELRMFSGPAPLGDPLVGPHDRLRPLARRQLDVRRRVERDEPALRCRVARTWLTNISVAGTRRIEASVSRLGPLNS